MYYLSAITKLHVMKFFKYLLVSLFTFMLVIACGGGEKKKEEPKKVKIGVQKEIKKKDASYGSFEKKGILC